MEEDEIGGGEMGKENLAFIQSQENASRLEQIAKVIKTELLGSPAPWVTTNILGGYISYTSVDVNHPGHYDIHSSSNANSGLSVLLYPLSIKLNGNEKAIHIIKTADIVSNITRRIGFHNSSTVVAPTDSVCFEIINGTIKGVCTNNSTVTETTTTFTLSSSTWYRLSIELNTDATIATFKIYADDSDSVLWQDSIANNIPKTRALSHGDIVTYSAGSDRTIGYIDRMDLFLMNERKV